VLRDENLVDHLPHSAPSRIAARGTRKRHCCTSSSSPLLDAVSSLWLILHMLLHHLPKSSMGPVKLCRLPPCLSSTASVASAASSRPLIPISKHPICRIIQNHPPRRSLSSTTKMATLASFKAPKVSNEPNVCDSKNALHHEETLLMPSTEALLQGLQGEGTASKRHCRISKVQPD
jgi:hypothetical protein